jgi:hypothetical protein
MDYFNLPSNTVVQRVVPKNSFDSFTNSKQKEMFTKDIAKIVWSNSLSTGTINLQGKEIQEIQIFTIELKEQKEIKTLLDIIDKAIPYHIIFVVEFGDWIYFSTSSKHLSPLNDTKSVIDWTYTTPWFKKSDNKYTISLRKSIDNIFYEFCQQLSFRKNKNIKNIADLSAYNSKLYTLTKEIERLKKSITSCQQFNRKVEMNLLLKELESELSSL